MAFVLLINTGLKITDLLNLKVGDVSNKDILSIEYLFQLLAIEKNDFKKIEREKLIAEIIDFKESASNKIYKYILNSIREVNFNE